MPRPAPRPTPYLAKPRRLRRSRFVALRWRIACDPDGQGLFACRHALPGTPTWRQLGLGDEAIQGHADIRFLSVLQAREGVWFSARVATVEQAVGEWIEEQLNHVLAARLEAAGLSWDSAFHWGQQDEPGSLPALPVLAGPDGKPRTIFGFLAAAWTAVDAALWERAPVATGVKLDPAYPVAVGLQAVVAAPNLTPEVLADFIRDFRARGETNWQAPVDWAAQGPGLAQSAAHTASVYARLAGQ